MVENDFFFPAADYHNLKTKKDSMHIFKKRKKTTYPKQVQTLRYSLIISQI